MIRSRCEAQAPNLPAGASQTGGKPVGMKDETNYEKLRTYLLDEFLTATA